MMPVTPANPYRQILRRRWSPAVPWVLALFLGFWLTRQHFGGMDGYPPGTEQLALLKIDRDLRLAEGMADDPAWLRWLAGVDRLDEVRARGAATLQALWRAQREASAIHGEQFFGEQMSLEGFQALEVLRARERDRNLLRRLANAAPALPTPEGMLRTRLGTGSGGWWEAELLRAYGPDQPENARVLQLFQRDTERLRRRAIVARTAVWGLILAGVGFLPRTSRQIARAVTGKARGYASAWSATLGGTVFLAATLAWIGFSMAISLGLLGIPRLSEQATLFLETAVRLLPALIAIGFLFRRPRHALRVLGLDRRPDWPLTLGTLAALLLFDGALSRTFEHWVRSDPTGGLSGADAGLNGLVFLIVSACFVAPVTEEILYRGVLFRSLANRFGTVPGAAFSAAVFAAIHFYNLYGLASVGWLGFACAMAFAASGRLSTAVALHILYNAAIKLPEWFVYHAELS
jgi:membrane protease YdiL (CAAX protease family)